MSDLDYLLEALSAAENLAALAVWSADDEVARGNAKSMRDAISRGRLAHSRLAAESERLREALRAEAEACLAAEMVAVRLRRLVRQPNEPGAYEGDTFYPVGGTEASHRWNGERWEWMPALSEQEGK